MRNLFVSNAVFARVRDRWLAWGTKNYVSLDPAIADTVKLLNTFPGIATMWCCEGHPNDPLRHVEPMDAMYIAGVITEAGYPHLMEIFDRIQQANLTGDHDGPDHWNGGVVKLEFSILNGAVLDIDGYYAIWILQGHEGLDLTHSHAVVKEAVSSYHKQREALTHGNIT